MEPRNPEQLGRGCVGAPCWGAVWAARGRGMLGVLLLMGCQGDPQLFPQQPAGI